MEKIIEYFKKEYKIIIPLVVVIVLLISIYFIYREYRYDNYRNKVEDDVYQYFGGIRNDYRAIITYNLKDVIVDVKAKNKKIEYDSTPIYYKDINKVIFPHEMSIVFPLKDVSQYKLYKYSTYEFINEMHEITNENNSNYYSYFFLYDGNNLFFFPDEVTLYVNNSEYTKLGKMSYVSVVGGYTLTYYDKEKDKSEVIELDNDIVSVKNEQINVNLTEKYTTMFNKKVLLTNPYNLNSLIDK